MVIMDLFKEHYHTFLLLNYIILTRLKLALKIKRISHLYLNKQKHHLD